MAEWKYDLALVNTQKEKKIQSQAWYKERLRTKFLKNRKPSDQDKSLVGARWQFLHDGLDDFRDGLPPDISGPAVVKGSKQLEPTLQGDSSAKRPPRKSLTKGRLTKEEVAYSTVTPLQQQRRDHIDELEYGLLQHPLALYPHLEESIPPDLFEDVVDLLDPEMNMYSDDEEDLEQFPEDSSRINSTSGRGTKSAKQDSGNLSGDSDDMSGNPKNPYKWLTKESEPINREDKRGRTRRSQSPSQDEHITNVTRDFCSWVSGLGGETNNIEETTIESLFASGYETKPALSVPVHVVELTNVPPELRMSSKVSQEAVKEESLDDIENIQKQLYKRGYMPSWVKSKYGAWYLDPTSWKLRSAEENFGCLGARFQKCECSKEKMYDEVEKQWPLEDPEGIKENEMSEAKKKSLAMDEQLATLHGAISFKTFAERKGTRVPEFLERVAMFQAKAMAEKEASRSPDHQHTVGSAKAYTAAS